MSTQTMDTSKHNITIKWLTRDTAAIRKIRERFNIPNYTTVNGWSPAEIPDEDMELFRETAKRGFFSILGYKWCKNGVHFSFIYRK